MYLEEEVARINNLLKQLDGKSNIVIWGAAENTIRLFQHTEIWKYSIKNLIDKQEVGVFFGIPIVKPQNMVWGNIEAVVVSSFFREKEIVKEARDVYGYRGLILPLNREGQRTPFYQHMCKTAFRVPDKWKDILACNVKFHNIHNGERLFILCNGPSMKEMDLKRLENEHTMAVSNFYLHDDYRTIKPQYYCFAQFSYTERFTKQVALDWLMDIQRHGGGPQYFFSTNEKGLIEKTHVMDNERVNYIYFGKDSLYYEDICLDKPIMPVQSVPIMCIQIALYMGFKEIYLLGTEHDIIMTSKYRYFYDNKKSIVDRKDISIGNNGEVNMKVEDLLKETKKLWEQYSVLKYIAESYGAVIFNATRGGMLDIFERVDFDTIL